MFRQIVFVEIEGFDRVSVAGLDAGDGGQLERLARVLSTLPFALVELVTQEHRLARAGVAATCPLRLAPEPFDFGAQGCGVMRQLRVGGLPVRNFTGGRLVDASKETFKLGGDHIRERNMSRGGQPSHACMPGCMIECSNVYVDDKGKEIVSPLEYETLGLMGSNCGLKDPDDVARVNAVANDLGVDTIDLAECTRRRIYVANIPDYCVEEVATHALTLILNWSRKLPLAQRATEGGRWEMWT